MLLFVVCGWSFVCAIVVVIVSVTVIVAFVFVTVIIITIEFVVRIEAVMGIGGTVVTAWEEHPSDSQSLIATLGVRYRRESAIQVTEADLYTTPHQLAMATLHTHRHCNTNYTQYNNN